MEASSLTAVFESVEGGWVQGRVAELPGVITAAPTRAQAEEDLRDALKEYLLSLQEAPLDEEVSVDADRVALELVYRS